VEGIHGVKSFYSLKKFRVKIARRAANLQFSPYQALRIISLCGGDTWSEIILLEKFRVKIARSAVDLQFSPYQALLLSTLNSCPDDGSRWDLKR